MGSLSVVSAHQLKPGTIAAVIPKEIREKLGIGRGTELVVYEAGGEVVMVPLNRLRSSRRAGRPQLLATTVANTTDTRPKRLARVGTTETGAVKATGRANV